MIFSHRAVTPPLACKSLASLDIVFQISIKRLVRPAEREDCALRIEDLRVDRPIPPLFWRVSCDAAKNRGLAELGQGGDYQQSGFLCKFENCKNLQFISFQFFNCGCLHLRYSGFGNFFTHM